MESLINSMNAVKVDDYYVIRNDLQHLAMAFSNGKLEHVSFPPLEEEYPYELVKNAGVLYKIMKSILPNENEVDIISLVNYYIDLVQKTEEY